LSPGKDQEKQPDIDIHILFQMRRLEWVAPRVRVDTFNKPDFERIKELKALINGIFMKAK